MDVGALSAKELARLEALLVQRFCPPLTADSVARCLGDCAATFAHARVRNFLSILVEREVADRLRGEMQRARGADREPARMRRAG
jgi:hypothetical protein